MMKVLHIKVKPNSKQQKIQTTEEGSLLICLKSPPTDGKANRELIKLLAKEFKVPQSNVRIKLGQSSKQKLVEIDEI